jgi:hypothetical protein
LNQGELLLVIGAGVIVILAFALFSLLFDTRLVTDLELVASLALLVVIWLQVSGRHDFGTNYRLAAAGLGAFVAVLVAVGFLYQVRRGFGGLDLGEWLGLLSLWGGAAIVAVGSWLTWAGRR